MNKEHLSPTGTEEEEHKEINEEEQEARAEVGSCDTEEAEDSRSSVEKELEDRLLRLHAEFDNYRKRTARERAEQATIAQAALVSSLLPVLDNFERALANLPSEADTGWAEGVQLVHKQLLEVLSQQGLERIDCEQPFDPNVHEAVMREACGEEVAEGTILQELQPGYLFQGRLLRPSMVKVATRN
ncbi:MAG: nucleotide exchange factor GrpE [Firmicutes bacterium]|nr:nucleotide exchange factor GrpE [Bacillota bacterium]